MVRLGRSSTVAGVASGGAQAPRIALAVMVEVGLPPLSGELVRETPVWWCD
jgi:hypothetical protein